MDKILILVDMQNDFIDGSLGTKEAQSIVPSVIEKIEKFDGDIFATFDTHSADYSKTNEGKNLPIPHCIEGTFGWQLNDSVNAALDKKGYTAVIKPTFGSITLSEMIKSHYNVNNIEIELIGLCTDICVVSNALLLKAYFPEAEISVNANCCAGTTPEAHEAALVTMQNCHIKVR